MAMGGYIDDTISNDQEMTEFGGMSLSGVFHNPNGGTPTIGAEYPNSQWGVTAVLSNGAHFDPNVHPHELMNPGFSAPGYVERRRVSDLTSMVFADAYGYLNGVSEPGVPTIGGYLNETSGEPLPSSVNTFYADYVPSTGQLRIFGGPGNRDDTITVSVDPFGQLQVRVEDAVVTTDANEMTWVNDAIEAVDLYGATVSSIYADLGGGNDQLIFDFTPDGTLNITELLMGESLDEIVINGGAGNDVVLLRNLEDSSISTVLTEQTGANVAINIDSDPERLHIYLCQYRTI